MFTLATASTTSSRASDLERRLDEGYRMIEDRKARGYDVAHLEDFWIELLHEYEALFDALPEAA